MKREIKLCGRCIAILRNFYDVKELEGRVKIECENCGRKRYGAMCAMGKRQSNAKP